MLMSWMLSAALAAAPPALPKDAATQAGEQAWMRMLDAAATSPSARDRALSASVPAGWPESDARRLQRGRALRDAAAAAPADALVQWLWASAPDDQSGCDARDPCPERAMAHARLDPGNAFAWATEFQRAKQTGDEAAARAALHRMATADQFAEPYVPLIDAWRDLLRRYPVPDAVQRQAYAGLPPGLRTREGANAVTAIAVAAARSFAPGPFRACDATREPLPSDDVLEDCRKLARLMLQAPTASQRSIGGAMLQRAGGDFDRDAARRQSLWWQSAFQWMDDSPDEWSRYLEDLHSTQSEIRALELVLHRAGRPLTPPADWVYQPPRAVVEAANKAAAEAAAEAAASASAQSTKAPANPGRP